MLRALQLFTTLKTAIVRSAFLYFLHYENLLMQYTDKILYKRIFQRIQRIFSALKNENFIRFLFKDICSKHRLWVHARTASPSTCTHNLCFGPNIRKLSIPLHTPVLPYKSGVDGGIRSTDVFS